MRHIIIGSIIATLPALAMAAPAGSFNECLDHFPNKTPPQVQETTKQGMLRALCYEAFAILHSGTTKTPVYVVERLNTAKIKDADEKRNDKFFADARLPSKERAVLEDYKGSGFDRGHMAPAADMPTPTAMAQSFSLANMVPQNSENNRGPWSSIERATRDYAARARGDVYVFTGPLYEKTSWQTVHQAGTVSVPSHLFKLVYDVKAKNSWVHLIENRDGVKPGKPISYTDFVKRTGLNLLPQQ